MAELTEDIKEIFIARNMPDDGDSDLCKDKIERSDQCESLETQNRKKISREDENIGAECLHDCPDMTAPQEESSVRLVSAGQIRARCSSAKSLPNSKNSLRSESTHADSDVEMLKNVSIKVMKSANLMRKSPGLACRLQQEADDFVGAEGDFQPRDAARENSEAEATQDVADDGEDLTNYENQLMKLEREEKLEKIARIDLLYQRQIESEMNAGVEAHLEKVVQVEAELKISSSGRAGEPNSSQTESCGKKKKPNFFIDPSGSRRKIVKSGRSLFARFPGKSVNLPSVEDGLSSGNVSGEDEDCVSDDAGDDSCDKINAPHFCSLPVVSALLDDDSNFLNKLGSPTVEILNSSEEAPEIFEIGDLKPGSSDLEVGGTFESNDQSENHEASTSAAIACDSSDDKETNGRSDPVRSQSLDVFRDDGAEESRVADETDACLDSKNIDTKNIDAKNIDTKNIDAKNIDTKNIDAKNVDSNFNDIIEEPAVEEITPDDGGDKKANPLPPSIVRDMSIDGVQASTAPTATTACTAGPTPSMTTSLIADVTISHDISNEGSSDKEADATENGDVESRSRSPSLVVQKKSPGVEAQALPSDVPKAQPVPLPHIRVGSDSCAPAPLDSPQKPRADEKIETEVFELQPILGIPHKATMVHRSPSPSSFIARPTDLEISGRAELKGVGQPRIHGPSTNAEEGRRYISSSADVENAIRDIKSAILKSKDIKLTSPQQIEDLPSNSQTEPVWITRQAQDINRSYRASSSLSSSMMNKNRSGRQESNCMGSALTSEDEGEKFSRAGDNFTVKGHDTPPGRGLCWCDAPSPTSLVASALLPSELRNYSGVCRRHPDDLSYPPRGRDCAEVAHVPNTCERYDCHECRHLPDDEFDDEDEEEEDEDDEFEEDDGVVEVINDYAQVVPQVDVASPCRIHNRHHHLLPAEDISPSLNHKVYVATEPVTGCSNGSSGGGSSNDHTCRVDSLKHDHVPEYSTDEETDNLLKKQYTHENVDASVHDHAPSTKQSQSEQRRNRAREVALRDPGNESVLIEGVLFRANYLGSTQLISEGQPSKAMRMMQAQEAVGRIKAPDGESQPSTEVDLFVSVEKIMVLNTNLQEIMMDHALRTISYIADIGDILVIMARRGSVIKNPDIGPRRTQTKICCHVFESEEAQLIAQSIGQAFQVSYVEFLKVNGIEGTANVKNMDYQDVLNQQEVYGEELYMLSNKEMQREVIVSKVKGEPLGVVIVESGWGSMIPTMVLANMAPCGAAARCNQLNIGDQIISINGISMVGLPLTTCQSYIKAAKSQSIVKLTVVSCPPVVEVLIKRPDVKYQLGFSVQNGVICSLLRGGIAERGGVRVGHRIIEINRQSVVATHHEKIVSMLAMSAGEIHMKTMPTSIFHLLTGQIMPHYI